MTGSVHGILICFGRYGTIQHEMYHALGFYHEQSRSERDDYVIIHWQNIEPLSANNFLKHNPSVITPFGEPYDYGSAMHYSRNAFSFNGLDTMTLIVSVMLLKKTYKDSKRFFFRTPPQRSDRGSASVSTTGPS
jgi:hypothetical protein